MTKGPVNFLEMHAEKAALALGALALVAMAALYFVRSPNTIEYNGQRVGAGELDGVIRQNAESLDKALTRDKPPPLEVPDYSGMLDEQHSAGVLGGPAQGVVAAVLPLATEFGKPVPALQEDEEASHDVVLVTPLKPTLPVLESGISEVVRRQTKLGATAGPPAAPAAAGEASEDVEAAKPLETSWVTAAAYFSRKSQQEEMTKARYATHRTKVYVAGVDVQRQEMQASGEFSDWQDVVGSKAMPRIDIPNPQVNEQSGALENHEDIKDAFRLVQASQNALMQPEFYSVQAGDFWEVPPLAGYQEEEDQEEEQAIAKEKAEKREKEKEKEKEKKQAHPTGGKGSGPAIAGGGKSGTLGGGKSGTIGGSSGGAHRTPSRSGEAAAAAGKEKREAREKAHQDFIEAQKAYARKEYSQAESVAKRVVDNEQAAPGDENGAKKILRLVKKALERQQRIAGAGGPSGGSHGSVVTIAPSGRTGGPAIAGGSRSGPPAIAGGGRTQPMIPGIPGAAVLAPPPTIGGDQPAAPANLVTYPGDPDRVAVWFHDDTVQPGKTYRYRMRVKLWNRYVGQLAALKDPEQARRTVLPGDWSLASAPITVAPSTHFFVGGPTVRKDQARVEVWKWHKGDWLKEAFEVCVGDEIGGPRKTVTEEFDENGKEVREEVDFTTGAVVLDLRFGEPVLTRTSAGKEGQFRFREDQSVILVYIDPVDGQVKQRVQAFDRYDPMYKKLKEEL